ncbi:MAG: sulfite exporter TauE/SafE family protein [Hyphomicrobiaceae bacterium]
MSALLLPLLASASANDMLLFVAIGFGAQRVDGALGMAYGLTATSILLSFGTTAAVASASVHAAEVFTTATSGAAHWKLGNVNRAILLRLVPAGMAGGFLGAHILAAAPGDALRPWVAGYLLLAGGVVLLRGLKGGAQPVSLAASTAMLVPLGFIGGFLDAIGGGGWGALVTTTLLCKGTRARIAIGTASLAEFFVTLTISATFFASIGLALWPVIIGLVIGGVLAAPLAAMAARHLPDRPLMILVGALIVLLALRQIVLASG